MPARLRPTAPIAADAILVGDPGRALLLAQELLEQPKMSNHARGLWGYFGRASSGRELTIQSTGIGGPSATLVLGDLAELGVRRAVRVGTCVALAGSREAGELAVVSAAIAQGGSAAALGLSMGSIVEPDSRLTARLAEELDGATQVPVASVDAHPEQVPSAVGAEIADMQTAPLLARARGLGIAMAAALIVERVAGGGGSLSDDARERAERRLGRAASSALSG